MRNETDLKRVIQRRKNPKEREREQRQNDIIDAARKLLAHRDFIEISMEEIAREVGLGKSTLYLYFKNKESLYFAIVLRGIRIWAANVKEEVKKGKTGLEKFRLYGNLFYFLL